MPQLRYRLLSAFAAVIVGSASALPANTAENSLSAPKGPVILVIEGNIDLRNVDDTAQFDRPMLESIGTVSFVTSTPWYDNPVEFEGVPLDKLLDAVGATGAELTAIALNDYQATLPLSGLGEDGAVLALKRDGKYMEVRDKGPLFIVYPYDSDPRLAAQEYYARSVWQVSRLVIR